MGSKSKYKSKRKWQLKTTTTKTASSAVALQAQLDLVTKERDQNLATAQQALNIANSFGGWLAVIDQAAIPFKSGGFLKNSLVGTYEL